MDAENARLQAIDDEKDRIREEEAKRIKDAQDAKKKVERDKIEDLKK